MGIYTLYYNLTKKLTYPQGEVGCMKAYTEASMNDYTKLITVDKEGNDERSDGNVDLY